MNPAVVVAAAQLILLASTTLQQYSNGTITDAEALQQLKDAYANLENAIDVFNKAPGPAA